MSSALPPPRSSAISRSTRQMALSRAKNRSAVSAMEWIFRTAAFFGAAREHLFRGPSGIAGREVDAARSVLEPDDVETSLEAIEHGLFDAIIRRQTADENPLH